MAESASVAKMIDHALLDPRLTVDAMDTGCRMARQYDVASVCVMPFYVERCAELLEGSEVKTSATIAFPHGGTSTLAKQLEAEKALADGAEELDMVININRALSGDWDYVRNDIRAVLEATHEAGQRIKVIFENCYLEDYHKRNLCEICSELDADWVKTSTGFGPGGATLEDLQMMIKHTNETVQVKASGGIRGLKQALDIQALGVTRIGCSRTKEILDEQNAASTNGA